MSGDMIDKNKVYEMLDNQFEDLNGITNRLNNMCLDICTTKELIRRNEKIIYAHPHQSHSTNMETRKDKRMIGDVWLEKDNKGRVVVCIDNGDGVTKKLVSNNKKKSKSK